MDMLLMLSYPSKLLHTGGPRSVRRPSLAQELQGDEAVFMANVTLITKLHANAPRDTRLWDSPIDS